MNPTKTVFITGASSGIGKATAMLFARRGWNTVATMRDTGKAGDLEHLPGVRILACDVTKQETINDAIETVYAEFGSIDVLVNNAGYGLVGPFESTTPDQVHRQFEVNVFGLQSMIRAVLPNMRERAQGVIVNISSIGGRMAFPLYSQYHATKWAVDGFSESLQYELAELGIRVKVVEPGPVKTEFYGSSIDMESSTEIDAYQSLVSRVLPKTTKEVKGATAEEIAQVIFRASVDQGSRLRYPAGSTGKLILWLRCLLPDRVFFFLIRKILI
ncbi:SDR family oxidoreductase [Candidatus Uhrbacteria bacterium]|nr:SDR family oxidoreductase [Candidatus Uhrbacteria bacterium]